MMQLSFNISPLNLNPQYVQDYVTSVATLVIFHKSKKAVKHHIFLLTFVKIF